MKRILLPNNNSIMINKNILDMMKKNVDPANITQMLQKDSSLIQVQEKKSEQLTRILSRPDDPKKEIKKMNEHIQKTNQKDNKQDEKKDNKQDEKKDNKQNKKSVPKVNDKLLFRRHEKLKFEPPEEYKKYNKIKVGITCAFFHNLYSNGHKFNTLLWYDFLRMCGYDTYYIVRKKTQVPEKEFQYVRFEDNDLKELEKIDVFFMVGTLDQSVVHFCRTHKKRYIYTIMGSTYHNDVRVILDQKYKNPTCYFHIQEGWMSPHFEFCREYYKVKYKTDKLFVGPYFWRDDLMLKHNIMKTVNRNFLKLRVAIVEPNIELAKNCVIPVAICEKARNLIEHVYVFNTYHLRDNTAYKNYIANLQVYRDKKLSIENRYPLGHILSNYANCVVSCVRDCDLNYVHLECFYLGIPIVHNSKMLKNYGYYYPDYDVSKGAEQLKYILMSHNREEYIKRHKPILQKYSIYNKQYQAWVHARLSEENETDCG